MATADFVMRWGAFRTVNPVLLEDPDYDLRTATSDDPHLSRLSAPTRQFLLEVGLPKSFSGLIWFDDVSGGLKRVCEVYGPSASWTAEEKEALERYIVIGFDGQDNPICLDESGVERLVVLDHDGMFHL